MNRCISPSQCDVESLHVTRCLGEVRKRPATIDDDSREKFQDQGECVGKKKPREEESGDLSRISSSRYEVNANKEFRHQHKEPRGTCSPCRYESCQDQIGNRE